MANPASFAKDQNGNGYLFYPGTEGPIPSIRLHALGDGMEDYEYLHRLHELVEEAKARGGAEPALLQKAETLMQVSSNLVESLRSYSKEPQVLLSERQAIAETIVELQKQLARLPVSQLTGSEEETTNVIQPANRPTNTGT